MKNSILVGANGWDCKWVRISYYCMCHKKKFGLSRVLDTTLNWANIKDKTIFKKKLINNKRNLNLL